MSLARHSKPKSFSHVRDREELIADRVRKKPEKGSDRADTV